MPKNSVKSILITGHKGFIGSRLMKALEDHYNVSGIDREDLDISFDYDKLYNILNERNPDLIIHCAANIGRIWGEENPITMLNNNIFGTFNIADVCLKRNIKLINFATSEVCFPLTNIYGISKDSAEKIVKHYSDNYGLKAVSIRPFMIYGPGIIADKYRSALDIFISKLLKREIIDVHKGTRRAWLHIDDFIEAIKLIVKKEEFEVFKTYNIGSEEYLTMEQIANILVKKIGGQIRIVDNNKFLTKKKLGDFRRIHSLGWCPKRRLAEGLEELIKWHKSYTQVSN